MVQRDSIVTILLDIMLIIGVIGGGSEEALRTSAHGGQVPRIIGFMARRIHCLTRD